MSLDDLVGDEIFRMKFFYNFKPSREFYNFKPSSRK
jgi:hypothetical protein